MGGTVVEVGGGTAVVVVPTEGAEVVAGAVVVAGTVVAAGTVVVAGAVVVVEVVVEVVGATGLALTADEALPVPAALTAETRNRYPVPLASEVTV